MSDEPYASWMDSLHAFPELAEHVGQFMASFAALEHLLWSLYGKMLGSTNNRSAIALLGHIESFAIKLTAMKNFIPYCHLPQPQREMAATLFNQVREINAFRNSLAHGLYLSDEKGTRVEILAYATSTDRKPKQSPLTTTLLARETKKIFAVRDEIRRSFFPEFADSHRPEHIR
jgi:hypothetical protein